MRFILLKIATGEVCRDADEYTRCAQARWTELYSLFSAATSPFYKNVAVVHNIECEAAYEHEHCLVFELLLSLEGTNTPNTAPDVIKPALRKVVAGLCTKGDVLLKKVVPPPPDEACVKQEEPASEGALSASAP